MSRLPSRIKILNRDTNEYEDGHNGVGQRERYGVNNVNKQVGMGAMYTREGR